MYAKLQRLAVLFLEIWLHKDHLHVNGFNDEKITRPYIFQAFLTKRKIFVSPIYHDPSFQNLTAATLLADQF